MGTMVRSNGHEVGFKMVEKNENLSDTCGWEKEIVTSAGGKGH